MVAIAAVVAAGAGLAVPPLAHTKPSALTPARDSEWRGSEWKALSESAKEAYLRGFLAGAAAEQARTYDNTRVPSESPAASDTDGLIRRVDDLHAAHTLHFPFAPSLYASQLDDFYWWDDHRSVPVISALVVINRQLLSHGQ